MRLLPATVAVFSLGLTATGSAGAVPKPPPKFWSATRCEHVLLTVYGGPTFGFPLPAADGHVFHVGQALCVGSGGPNACRWTSGRRTRLFAEFAVFTHSRLNGGIVRSWTLDTRAGPGLVPVRHHAGDRYAGWPADFYMSSVEVIATGAAPARFRSIVVPIAAQLAERENATGCAGVG